MSMRDSARMVRHTMRLSVRADRRTTVTVGVFVMLQAGLAAAIAYSQRLVVDAVGTEPATGLLAAVAIGTVAYTLQLVGARVSHNYRNDLCNRVQMQLEQEITEATARIPTVVHLERADYLNRVTMLRRGTLALTNTGWAAAYGLSALTSIVLSFWLLAGVHPLLAVLAVCAVPILPLTDRARRIQRKAIDATSEPLRKEAALHDLCLDPEPAKEVWISGNGRELDRRAVGLWQEAARQESRAQFRGVLAELAGWTFYFAALGGALLLVGHLLSTGSATAGDAVLVISLAGQLRLQQWTAVQGITQVADGGRVAEHHRWLLDHARTTAHGSLPAPRRLRQGIELRNVSFTYPGTRTPVLQVLNLNIPAGSSLGIVGLNGAGKSTLIKLLTGVHEPTSGSILVDGTDLRTLDPAQWRAVSTGVLQDFAKLQVPVREAVGVGDLPRIDDTHATAGALRRAGATHIVDQLPHGADTQLGRVFAGVELSHGQWQRIALARGLMRQTPLLLLLDEPTAALDPQAEHDLFEQFAEQTRDSAARGAVTVLVSHRFSTMHMAEQIVVVSQGRISEYGTHAELLAAGGEYADLYRTQAHAYQ
ncbi:ABC transporter ATP-binding protein [Streptomyces sp. NPDC002838]|uniref:ABC transporter ATP-binding protein n=1 Tax=Streptomyces sp. NPDC002838 TaxID=3154436 RepID=UPI003333422A